MLGGGRSLSGENDKGRNALDSVQPLPDHPSGILQKGKKGMLQATLSQFLLEPWGMIKKRLLHSNPFLFLSTPGFQTSSYIWYYWSLLSSCFFLVFYLPGSSFTGLSSLWPFHAEVPQYLTLAIFSFCSPPSAPQAKAISPLPKAWSHDYLSVIHLLYTWAQLCIPNYLTSLLSRWKAFKLPAFMIFSLKPCPLPFSVNQHQHPSFTHKEETQGFFLMIPSPSLST